MTIQQVAFKQKNAKMVDDGFHARSRGFIFMIEID